MKRTAWLLCSIASALAAPSGGIRAQAPVDEEIRPHDEVTWMNRGSVTVTTGTILNQNEAEVQIKTTTGGQFNIKREQVTSVKPHRRPEDIFKEKKQRLYGLRTREERGAQYLDLGLWCCRPYAILDGEPPMPERAFEYLKKAVEINPRAKQAYPLLLDKLAERREAAMQQGGSPTRAEIEEELNIYMLAKEGGFEDPEIDFRTAEILHESLGRTVDAIRLFEKVLAGQGKEGGNQSLRRRARRKLVDIYRERGEADKVRAILPASPAGDLKDPSNFEALWEKVKLLVGSGKAEDRAMARGLLGKALEANPNSSDVHRQIAALDFADGKFSTAEVRLARLAQGGSGDPDLLVDLTLAQIRQGKFKPALALLNRMLGDSPPASRPPELPAAGVPAVVPAAPPEGGTTAADPGGAPPPADGSTPEAKASGEAAGDGGVPPRQSQESGPEESSAKAAGESAPEESTDPPATVAVGGGTARQRARAHAARGVILDYRGDAAAALSEYQKAARLDASNATAILLLAGAQLRTGDVAGSRATLDALIKGNADRRGLFGAYARLKADVEIADGQPAKALNLLEYAATIDSGDALLRQKIGTVLLMVNEVDRAYAHLAAATKLILPSREPSLMNALACFHYRRGNYDEARGLFSLVSSLVPRPRAEEGKPPPRIPPEHTYATVGLGLSDDARKLEVWQDDFNREGGSDVARNWNEVELYGVSIEVKDGHLVFQGQQTAPGVTEVTREELVESVERVSARLRFDGSSGPVRAGIRLLSADARGGGPPSAGLVFFRDGDGTLKYSRKTGRGDWEDGQPTTEKDPTRGKPVYAGDIRWPAGSEFHTLTIRRGAKNTSGFDLLLDQKPVAQNVAVEGLRGKTLLVGISGQVEALNVPYRFEADDFRLYRLKASDERSKQR
jgi:tetratricopeptide (TPR) repeat protein